MKQFFFFLNSHLISYSVEKDWKKKDIKEESVSIFALPYISTQLLISGYIEPCSSSLPLSPSLSLSLFHFHPHSLQPAASLSLKRGHCLSYVPRGMLGELAWPGPQLKSTLILLVSVREGRGITTPAFLQLPASSGPLQPLALIITIQIMSEIDVPLKQSWLAQTIRLI